MFLPIKLAPEISGKEKSEKRKKEEEKNEKNNNRYEFPPLPPKKGNPCMVSDVSLP